MAAKKLKLVTEKVGDHGLKGSEPVSIEGLTSTRVDPRRNGSKEAFKSHVEKVIDRNEAAKNHLMSLGAGQDFVQRGKLSNEQNINNKPTKTENLYLVEAGLNMMHRRNKDDFPEYGKDGSFTRGFVDPT